MIREGHYPKFSEMIDQIEHIALEYVKFETYLCTAKKITIGDRQNMEEILAGKKSIDDLDSHDQSLSTLPLMPNQKH